jgi:hypothetical protein
LKKYKVALYSGSSYIGAHTVFVLWHFLAVFTDDFSSSDTIMSNGCMIRNWKVYGRKRPWLNLRYYRGIFLDRMRKTRKYLGQYSLFPGRESNRTSPEQKPQVLPEIQLARFTQFRSRGCNSARLNHAWARYTKSTTSQSISLKIL